MAEERDRWTVFVEKLNELTLKGILHWASARPLDTKLDAPRKFIPIVFETEYKDHKLRLYEEALDDPELIIHYVVLEIINKDGVSWAFPEIEGLVDLLESVKFQVAGVNEYIEAVLADGIAKSR
jgi:hypothetical protein